MRAPRIRTLAVATALAVTASLAAAGTASADDATDLAAAAQAYALRVAAATTGNALLNLSHAADITCDTPKASGTNVTPAVDLFPVGTTYGNDAAEGADECLSLQRSPYTYHLHVAVLAFSKAINNYVAIPGCNSDVFGSAVVGVAPAVSPPILCTFAPAATVAGATHIVEADMYTSLTGSTPYVGYSLPYQTGLKASI